MTHQTIRVLARDAYRDAVAEMADPKYAVVEQPPPPAADLCLVERRRLPEYRDTLKSVVESERPAFYPIVLLRQRAPVRGLNVPSPDGSSLIDDVVTFPIETRIFQRRIENLLVRRRYSISLARHHERRHERFDGLFDAIAEPALVVDTGGEIIQVNDGFCRLLDERRDALFGRPVESVLDADLADGLFDPAGQTPAADGDRFVSIEDGTGAERHVKCSRRLVDVQGATYAVLLLTDITSIYRGLEGTEPSSRNR